MAKIDKNYLNRMSGMAYALKIAKEKGIDELENECRVRNAHYIPDSISKEKYREVANDISGKVMATFLPTCLFCINEAYGFGKKRLEAFKVVFMHHCDMLSALDPFGGSYETVSDYAVILKEKYGIEFDLDTIEDVATANTKRKRMLDAEYLLKFLRERGYDDAAAEIERCM